MCRQAVVVVLQGLVLCRQVVVTVLKGVVVHIEVVAAVSQVEEMQVVVEFPWALGVWKIGLPHLALLT